MAKKYSDSVLLGRIDERVKEMNEHIKQMNGTVSYNKTEIALIKQKLKIRVDNQRDMEYWSRKKFIAWFGGGFLLIQILIPFIIEYIKSRM